MSSPAAQQLKQTFRSGRAILLAAALCESAVAAVVALGVAAAIVAVVVEHAAYTADLRTLLQLLLFGAPVAAVVAVVGWRLRHLGADVSVAAQLEEAADRRGVSLQDDLRTAADFLAEREHDVERRGSGELKEAHLVLTAKRVRDSGALYSLPAVGLQTALPTLTVGFFAFLAAGLGVGLWGDAWADRLHRILDDDAAQQQLRAQARTALPVVRDLKLTLVYPSYQDRPDEHVDGASGSLLVPKGTRVTVVGTADRAFASASVLVGDAVITAEQQGERGVSASFVVDAEGEYRFRLKTAAGEVATDPYGHRIQLQLDEAPKVDLKDDAFEAARKARAKAEAADAKQKDPLAPVLPTVDSARFDDERVVQLNEEIDVQADATDDFGLTAFKLSVLVGDADDATTKVMLKLPRPLAKMHANTTFTPEEMGARPGDILVMTVMALDNDDVTGPNIGRSVSRTYRVFSATQHHRELIERQQELLDAMVDALAFDLTTPVPSRKVKRKDVPAHLEHLLQALKLHQRSQRLLSEVTSALLQDELRPKGVYEALSNMRDDLRPLLRSQRRLTETVGKNVDEGKPIAAFNWRRLSATQNERIRKVERHVLYLEDLLNQQRLDEVKQLSDELTASQERLKELMKQYKESGSEADRKKLLEEMKRMREKMSELMQRMAELRKDVPDQYLNHEAFETSKMQDTAQTLDDMLEQGDLDKALEAMENMLQQSKQLQQELDDSRQEYGTDEYSEQREQMEQFADELGALEQAQQELVEKTQRMMQSAQREAERKMKGAFQEKLKDIIAEVKAAQQTAHKIAPQTLGFNDVDTLENAKARLQEVLDALDLNDVEEAMLAAEKAEMRLGDLHNRHKSSSFMRDLGFGGQSNANVAQMQKTQEHAEKARELLEELVPEPADMLTEPQREQLQRDAQAQQELQKRAQELAQKMQKLGEQMPVFGPDHKQKLSEAGQQMRQAQRALGDEGLREARRHQEGAKRRLTELKDALEQMGQQGGSGMPMALPSPGAQGQGQGDGRRHKDDKVEIPDADDYRVPDAFRKDILDAMREEPPTEWKGEVKKYYEDLVR